MSATDARPLPKKGVAYRHYFAIRKNDGTLITTWAGADSEVDKDGAGFSDCTNEATEIGTTGVGYIDLTSTEMNADAVNLKVTVTNTDALPLVFTFFPEEDGDIRVDATLIEGADPSDTIRDAVVDDATRIDASALNTASVTTIPAILADTGTTLQAELDGIQASIGTIADLGSGATIGANLDDLYTQGANNGMGISGLSTTLSIHQALIEDIPTVAEFEARTLVAADYTIVSDLGTVQTGDSFAIVNSGTHGNAALRTLVLDVPTVAEFEARSIAAANYALEASSQTLITNLGALTTTVGVAGAGLTAAGISVANILSGFNTQTKPADGDPDTWTWLEMQWMLARREFNENIHNADDGTIVTKDFNGDVITEQAATTVGNVETVGKAASP